MTFEQWYRETIIGDQVWDFDYRSTGTYKAMKKAYYHGMKRGFQLKKGNK